MTSILRAIKSLEKHVFDNTVRLQGAAIYSGNVIDAYADWLPPKCIVSDGPYGLGKFPGEPNTTDGLDDWYAPHVAMWAKSARPDTTLWFWNSEIGWATCHGILDAHGWEYEEVAIWDKGIAHVAGNVNSRTIRGLPVVTEIAVRYTRKLTLKDESGHILPAKEWLRREWQRSGLPLSQSNKAAGTANAATRKYLTQCDLWYFPPGEAVVAMANWCEKFGRKTSRPYFSVDGKTPISVEVWNRLRAQWNHVHGLTNVWQEPPVHNGERIKVGSSYLHANQKPLKLMQRQILACTNPSEVVWEPFGGLCSATIAAIQIGRLAHAAEVNPEYFSAAVDRVRSFAAKLTESNAA
jgi:hypothetical protein